MSALKEFANFITLNVANLAATYERQLIENGESYQTLPADGRTAFARKLIKTVVEACESETSAPLRRLFEERINQNPQSRRPPSGEPRKGSLPQPLLEVECLGQTLTPIVTNLEAGKFLWQTLSEVRAIILHAGASAPIPFSDKQADEALQDREARFRQVISSISDHIYVTQVTEEGKLVNVYLSPHVESLTGYPYEQFISDWNFWPSVVIHPDDRALAAKQAAQLVEGRNSRMEYRLVRANGDIIWVRDSGQVEKDATRPGITIYGVVSDITERKQAEHALQESEKRIRLIVDTALDAVITIDNKGMIMDWNVQAEASFGWSREEVIGLRLSDTIIPHQYRAAHDRGLEHFLKTGEGPVLNKRIEITALHRDGNEFAVELTITPLRLEENYIFSAYIRDISGRKKTEEALAKEHTLLRTLIDNLPDNIYVKDTESRFVLANVTTARNLGVTKPEELIGKTDFDFFPAEIATQYHADEQSVIRSGQATFNREEPTVYEAGKAGWASTTTVPLRDSVGQITGLVGVSRDITEHKRLEQQIQESLERRVRQVQTSTEVAQQVSAAAALDELFHRVVNLVQARFGYYHVQVYTMVEGDLVLQEGTGEAGQRMKEAGHKISLDAEKSLVVRAVWDGEPVLVPDVSQEPTWLPNPLLPETKAELAVPINLGAEVLGVLDVQSDTVGRLNEEDQLLLEGLCGQIAVAIDNRRIETERRRAEEKLVEERNLLRTVIDNLPDSIYVKDSEGRHLIVNKAMQDASPGPLEEMVGKTDLDLYPSEVALQWYNDDMSVIQSGQPVINREELKFDGDKHIGWDLTTKVPLHDGQGNVMGLVGMSRDITEQKRAQEKLVEERRILRTLIDSLPDEIYIKDAQCRFLNANITVAQIFGLSSPDELIGKTDLDLWPYEDAIAAHLAEQALIQSGQAIINHESFNPDSKRWRLETKVPVRDNQGQVVGLVGFNRFITELKEAEAERELSLAEAEARLKEIQALQQISQDLAKTLQVKEILDIFFQACTQVAGFEYVQLSLVDKERNCIKGIAGIGVTESNLKKAYRNLDEPDLLADIIRSGQTEILTGWDDRLDRAIFEAEGHGNWVRVFTPIKLREEIIGVVESGFNKSTRATIEDFQLRLLRVFIDQTALALDNAQRFEANQKAAQRERTIREITDTLRAAPNLERLVEVAAKELGQHLSATHVKLELGLETSSAPNANGG